MKRIWIVVTALACVSTGAMAQQYMNGDSTYGGSGGAGRTDYVDERGPIDLRVVPRQNGGFYGPGRGDGQRPYEQGERIRPLPPRYEPRHQGPIVREVLPPPPRHDVPVMRVVPPTKPYQAPTLPFDRFVDMCFNPNAIGNQIAPASINVVCEVKKVVWKQDGEKLVEFQNNGQMTAQANSEKGKSATYQGRIPVAPTTISCPIMKKYIQRFAPSFPISCEALRETGARTVIELCSKLMESGGQDKQADTGGELTFTGETFTNCPLGGKGD